MASNPSPVFFYGIELDLRLLHCLVVGKRPRVLGLARLLGFRFSWSAGNRQPNVQRDPEQSVEGILVHLTPEQARRLEAVRLVPSLYQWRTITVLDAANKRRRARMLWSPRTVDPGLPPARQTWRQLVAAAIDLGLSHSAINAHLQARPHDQIAPIPAFRAASVCCQFCGAPAPFTDA